jgi:hypothetical protein
MAGADKSETPLMLATPPNNLVLVSAALAPDDDAAANAAAMIPIQLTLMVASHDRVFMGFAVARHPMRLSESCQTSTCTLCQPLAWCRGR